MWRCALVSVAMWATAAGAVDIIRDTDEVVIGGVDKPAWLAFVADVFGGATVGQMVSLSCSAQGQGSCHYVECVTLDAAAYAAVEDDPMRSVGANPHRVAVDGSEAHAHVSWGQRSLTPAQLSTLIGLASATFGTPGTLCTVAIESEGGELLAHACHRMPTTNEGRLLCLKNATCRRAN